jgi:signal transduction histidine kinase
MSASLFSNDSPPEGLAFVCTADGAIERVVDQSLAGAPLHDSLAASVDESSREACTIFVNTVARGGFARSTPLRIGTRDLQCYGSCADRELRIVAVVDPLSAAPYAEVIAADRDEPAFTELAREIRRTHTTYELYEELAHVNNELVTAQRELARTVEQLKRMNSYKDELLGMAAHDLRNPLNANAAFITFLLQDAQAASDDQLVLLQRLRSNSEYMLRLVDDVLDFSAIEAGHVRLHPEESSLPALTRGVVDTMTILAVGKQIDIRYSAEANVPPVKVDRIKISQVIQNVISNAVQYSPPGTPVDVRLSAADSYAVLEVEDHGPGIKPEELPDLFKPFTRLSTVKVARERSVGLGLAITRRLVEAHGGTISVRSEVGRGSVFTIRLRAVMG